MSQTTITTLVVDDSRVIRLPIRPWLSVRFSQPILVSPLCQAEHRLWEAPSPEEMRQRAHGIFLARGGAPGKEMDDCLLAEQKLEREPARATPEARAESSTKRSLVHLCPPSS